MMRAARSLGGLLASFLIAARTSPERVFVESSSGCDSVIFVEI